jgi:hypothetical protein
MLEAEVREVYGDLRRALEEALEATLRHRRAKEALEAAIAQGIMAGEVAGKNRRGKGGQGPLPLPHALPGPAGGRGRADPGQVPPGGGQGPGPGGGGPGELGGAGGRSGGLEVKEG